MILLELHNGPLSGRTHPWLEQTNKEGAIEFGVERDGVLGTLFYEPHFDEGRDKWSAFYLDTEWLGKKVDP